jgi:hypothetical protein
MYYAARSKELPIELVESTYMQPLQILCKRSVKMRTVLTTRIKGVSNVYRHLLTTSRLLHQQYFNLKSMKF